MVSPGATTKKKLKKYSEKLIKKIKMLNRKHLLNAKENSKEE